MAEFDPAAAEAAKAAAQAAVKTAAASLKVNNANTLVSLTAKPVAEKSASDAFKELGTKASKAGEIMQALRVARPTSTDTDKEYTVFGNPELLEALNRAFKATVSAASETEEPEA